MYAGHLKWFWRYISWALCSWMVGTLPLNALAQQSMELKRIPIPEGMDSIAHVLFVDFTRGDILSLQFRRKSDAAVLSGYIMDNTVVGDNKSVSLIFDPVNQALRVRRLRTHSAPIILVLNLPMGSQSNFSTDGEPAKVTMYPFVAPITLHDGGIRLSGDWLSVVSPMIAGRPSGNPTQIGPGRFRVAGADAMKAITHQVQPKIPEGVSLGDPVAGVVVIRIEINSLGEVIAADRVVGMELLAIAAIEALKHWKFDVSRLIPGAKAIETNISFQFTKR